MTIESLAVRPHDQQIVSLLLACHDNREIGLHVGMGAQAVKNRLRSFYASAGIESGNKRVKLIQALSAEIEKKELPRLVPRERAIAELILAGRTNHQISLETGIGLQMIKNYASSIFDKCGVWSRTELAARFRCA